MQGKKAPNSAELGLTSVVGFLEQIATSSTSSNNLLDSMFEKIDNFFTGESLSSIIKDFNLKNYFSDKNKSITLLQDIKEILLGIHEEKADSKKESSSGKSDENISKFDLKSIKEFLTLSIDFSKGIELISKALTNKFFKLLDRFYDWFKKITEIDENKIKPFLEASENLTKMFDKLEKSLKPISIAVLLLAGSFLLLGLSLLMPTTVAGVLLLAGFLYFVQKVFSDKNLPKNLLDFSKSIGLLTLALVAMSFVQWESLLKMFVFIGGLLAIFAIGKKALGVTLPKGMLDLGMGLGLLTLALVAMTFVEWSSLGKMLVFMLGLTSILFLINKAGGGSSIPGIGKNAVLGLGFGLGLLVLALVAMSLVEWASIGKMLVFLLGLAAVMWLINKAGGSVGPMQGLPGFAFGLGLLVLAMFAMNELPWTAMAITLGFLLALGLILKLYNPQSGTMMLMIGGGILALSIGLLIFKKSGFTIMDAVNLAVSVLLIMGVVLLLGIPALTPLLITGSVMLILLGVTALISSVAFAAISALTITPANILNFVLSVGLLAIGFAALTPFILLALPASVLFLPIAVTALLTATVLLLISNLTITTENIEKFKLGVRGIIDSYTQIGIADVAEAMAKAILFLPIARISMITAIVLMLISKLAVTPQNISNFGISLNLLIQSYNSLNLLDVGSAVVKSNGVLVIVTVSMVAAIMFRFIGALDVQSGGRNLYLMVSYLTLVMNKLETWKNDNASNSIESIKDFVNSFREMDINSFHSITNTMERYLNMLSDDKKWASINKNLTSLNKNIKDIVTNINMLSLQKAFALERNLKLLAQKDNSANLTEAIRLLNELIGKISDAQTPAQTFVAAPVQTNTPGFGFENKPDTNNKPIPTSITESKETIESLLTTINETLKGKLKVSIVSGNINGL